MALSSYVCSSLSSGFTEISILVNGTKKRITHYEISRQMELENIILSEVNQKNRFHMFSLLYRC